MTNEENKEKIKDLLHLRKKCCICGNPVKPLNFLEAATLDLDMRMASIYQIFTEDESVCSRACLDKRWKRL